MLNILIMKYNIFENEVFPMNRISTGIKGLDSMLNGGLIPNRTYVVKGGPGAGKTTLAVQFLLEGAKKGEQVLYVTLEEPANELIQNMKSFGWNLKEYSNFNIYDVSPSGSEGWQLYSDRFMRTGTINLKDFYSALNEKLKSIKPKRLVIDPISVVNLFYKDPFELRRDLISLLKMINSYETTTLLLSEFIKEVQAEEFIVNGVFELREYEIRGSVIRAIRIKKMRGTAYDENIRPYKITDNGLVVYNKESLSILF